MSGIEVAVHDLCLYVIIGVSSAALVFYMGAALWSVWRMRKLGKAPRTAHWDTRP